jgi:hypothetical protein
MLEESDLPDEEFISFIAAFKVDRYVSFVHITGFTRATTQKDVEEVKHLLRTDPDFKVTYNIDRMLDDRVEDRIKLFGEPIQDSAWEEE